MNLKPCPFCGKIPTIKSNGGDWGYTPPSISIFCCVVSIEKYTEEYDSEKKRHINITEEATKEIIEQWNTRQEVPPMV